MRIQQTWAVRGALCALLLLAGCPSPWARYDYTASPATARYVGAGAFVPLSGEPIEVLVSASAGWQETELDLAPGDAVRIVADGMWNPDVTAGQRDCGPAGYRNLAGYYSPEIRSLPYGALIGRIGNGRPVMIGEHAVLAAEAPGRLTMTCNRTLNSTHLGRGEMDVRIVFGRLRAESSQADR